MSDCELSDAELLTTIRGYIIDCMNDAARDAEMDASFPRLYARRMRKVNGIKADLADFDAFIAKQEQTERDEP